MNLRSIFGGGRAKYPPDAAERTPPGQYLTEKWPVLHYGGIPRIDLTTWSFRIWGEVEEEVSLTWDQVLALPRRQLTNDIHCVTRWSKLDNVWDGVGIHDIVSLARPKPSARHALAHSYGGYTTNLPVAELLDDSVMVAYLHNGEPLTPEHGWPLRLVAPKLYFWKSAKWIRGIQFLTQDEPGFWEQYGYHNHGDPWKEERFG